MEFLQKAVLFPDAEHLNLLRMVAAILLFIYVAFTGVFAGSVSLSLLFQILYLREPDARYRRFARELLGLVSGNRSALLLLSLLPVITLLFTFVQIYQGSDLAMHRFLLTLFLLTVLGMAFVLLFSRQMERDETSPFTLLVGAAGVGLLVAAFFLLSNVLGLQLTPEKWPFVRSAFPFFATISSLPWFVLLTTVLFALTGAAVLYFFFRWPDRQPPEDPEYAQLVRTTGGGLAMAAVLAQPLAIFWVLKTFPEVAKSELIFRLWGVGVLILLAAGVTLLNVLLSRENRHLSTAFVLTLAAFFVVMTTSQIAGGVASREKALTLIAKAEEIHRTVAEEREARMAAAMNFDGSEIFTRICSACHKFDTKVVGPPLNEVKEKYQNDLDALQAFILKPVKIRPDYPPMPNQGLNRFEVEAVAKYLAEQWQSQQ